MLRWILKTLWLQKPSLLASAAGVAGAFVLVVILHAVFVGESRQVVAYVRHTAADVWVMQRGVGNMHMANSFVWDSKVKRIAELPGVRAATPILYSGIVVRTPGRRWLAFAVGLQRGATRGGPWAMAAGRTTPGPGEIVVPRVFADMAGVALGGRVSVTGRILEVVGLSEGSFSMGNSVVFMAASDLAELMSAQGTVSYIIVDAQPGQDGAGLAARIEQAVDKVSALPAERFIRNDYQLAMQMGTEIIAFMTLIGAGLAAVIIAFTAYSQVARRRRELAIAKALGVRNRAIYAAVGLQTLVITGLGLALALLAAWGLFPLLSALVPQITLVVTAEAMWRAAAVALVVASISAWIPARYVARVDPLTAFKG
ncbi:MAG: ABC transporter permease [Betaproteobacteria bacterium]|nr:ABC transporter permease [Betaproteobacteria bacterium]